MSEQLKMICELCAEDRARIMHLIQLLEQHSPQAVTLTMAPEPPSHPPQAAPAAAEPVVVELPELQKKVIEVSQLGTKHQQAVRALVNAYAERVTLIPPDKRAEVLEKLQEIVEGGAV